MEFIDVIKSRHSIRKFSDEDVDEEKLKYILNCARLAPSWVNKQCWHFIIIKDKNTIKDLSKKAIIINRWLKNVPCIIVACADPKLSGSQNGIDYFVVDVSIALQQLVLAATDVGLGSCWIGGFNEKKIKDILKIPKDIRVIALTPIGYPSEKNAMTSKLANIIVKSKQRKTLEEIVHRNTW